jgi:multimeric flavodoxin WrbA
MKLKEARSMLIVGLNGSPNRDANTVNMLFKALEGAKSEGAETRLVHVGNLLQNIIQPFCIVCSIPCNKSCYIGSELEEFFKMIHRVDGIIIGSPVYFGTVSAQLKALWDKSRDIREHKVLINVVGGALAIGASRFGGQETTISAIHDMMFVQGMILVGGGHPDYDAGHRGAASMQPANSDYDGLARARILGKRVAQVAKATMTLRERKER